VQHIGKLLVLYRPKKDAVKERSDQDRQGHARSHHRQAEPERHQEAERDQGPAQG
jgi:hypothetical protein